MAPTRPRRRRTLPLTTLAALMAATAASAQEPPAPAAPARDGPSAGRWTLDGRWTLEGRETSGLGARRTQVVLELDGDTLTRRVRDAAGERVYRGPVERRGTTLRVTFRRVVGARGALEGEAAGRPLRGLYAVAGAQVRGVVHDPAGAEGWTWSRERGARAGFAPAGAQPWKRVVLCLDGAPYEVLRDLHARGHFRAFQPPARLVTCYPSLSNPAWTRVLALPPGAGYQVLYYSNAQGRILGSTQGEMLGSFFETRMHHRHTGLIGHSLMYVLPELVGRRQLAHLLEELAHHGGSRSAFCYSVQTDAIAHMSGREALERALLDVEAGLDRIMSEFRARTGEALEVAIVSDHGHTLRSGSLVKIGDHLEARGWKVVSSVKAADECAFTSAGILSSVTIHCQEPREAALAEALASLEGVDLCTFDEGGARQTVVAARGAGRFTWDAARDAYRWEVLRGEDPLGYGVVFEDLRRRGRVDAGGFASSDDLFQATHGHRYPDAARRIRVGHEGGLVRNPSNVIVSLAPGYENGMGFVKATAALRGRSGTHGALDATNSSGVFMTTFLPAEAAVRAEDVRERIDLSEYHAHVPAVEVESIPAGATAAGEPRGGTLFARVPDDDGLAPIRVTVWRSRWLRDAKVWEGTFEREALQRVDGCRIVPLDDVLPRLALGKTYKIKVDAGRGVVGVTLEHRGTYEVLAAD